jgi:ribosomal protein L39E
MLARMAKSTEAPTWPKGTARTTAAVSTHPRQRGWPRASPTAPSGR